VLTEEQCEVQCGAESRIVQQQYQVSKHAWIFIVGSSPQTLFHQFEVPHCFGFNVDGPSWKIITPLLYPDHFAQQTGFVVMFFKNLQITLDHVYLFFFMMPKLFSINTL
jgi:hypothetical protein